MSVVKIVRPGLLTTVQDQGRQAFQRFGVAVSGAMDSYASQMANYLVGNDPAQAVLETTLMGPTLEMQQTCGIALTGADMSPTLDGVPVPMWEYFVAPQGSTLNFGSLKSGVRGYIAFAGGIDLPEVMGSRSTYAKAKVGGFEGRPLKAGDLLPVNGTGINPEGLEKRALPPSAIPQYTTQAVLRVVLGPQDDFFTQEGIDTFLSSTYQVTKECDRMGYRLEGNPIAHKTSADIISDGIIMGSVQVPGNGNPIILMADRQTTGGYTKIATVISVDLPIIAQAKAGDQFTFQALTVQQAQQIAREEKAKFDALTAPATPAAEPKKKSFFGKLFGG